MDLSIITVNTNDKEKIIPMLESVFAGTKNIDFEHIISDNNSTDGSLEEIRNKFPHVRIVENSSNVGFGAANNTGLKVATGEFVLFLNPDMRVESGSLEKIVSWMRNHEDVGVVSCKLVDQDGNLQEQARPRRFPKLFDQLALLLKIPHLCPCVLNSYLIKDFQPDLEQEVDSVRGSFMLTRRSITAKLGWAFDPRYFIWFEDVDTCREVKKLGYKIMYTPIISCVDYVGQSFKRRSTMQKQKWFTASMVKYFKKWEPWYCWLPIVLVRPLALGLTWLGTKLRKKKLTINN